MCKQLWPPDGFLAAGRMQGVPDTMAAFDPTPACAEAKTDTEEDRRRPAEPLAQTFEEQDLTRATRVRSSVRVCRRHIFRLLLLFLLLSGAQFPARLLFSALTVRCQNVRSVRNKLHTLRAAAPDLAAKTCSAWRRRGCRPTSPALSCSWGGTSTPGSDGTGLQTAGASRVRSGLSCSRLGDRIWSPTPPRCWWYRLAPPVPPFWQSVTDPRTMTDFTSIYECLAKLRATGRPVFVCGDFNLPELHWPAGEDPVIRVRSARAVQFVENLHIHGLIQSVHAPTRSDAVFDLVLSCGGDIDSDTTVSEGMFDSDHLETCYRFYDWQLYLGLPELLDSTTVLQILTSFVRLLVIYLDAYLIT